jgi:hypothetical protein
MNDYTFPTLTTAVEGFDDTLMFLVETLDPYVISTTNGTRNVGNLSALSVGISGNTKSGWLTGRRPTQGQVFPRGGS